MPSSSIDSSPNNSTTDPESSGFEDNFAHDYDSHFRLIDYSRTQIVDGGMGSLMETLNYKPDPVTWGSGANVSSPHIVQHAHELFINAGADIIITNTYQANIKRLKEIDPRTADSFVDRGVELAVSAVRKTGLPTIIVGSVGPFATYLADGSEYTGAYLKNPSFDLNIIRENYRLQTKALKRNGVQTFAFETIPTAVEARLAREIMEELDCRGWVSATCSSGTKLANGDDFVDFVRNVADSPNIDAIGINCTSPKFIRSLLQVGGPVARGKPFVVYPNSGETYNADNDSFFGETSIDLILGQVEEWAGLGARLVGGCCRVTPDDIRNISARLKRHN